MKKPKPEPIAIRCQHTRTMPVDELLQRQHPRNNNRHPLAQIEAFARILQHQGIRRAIVISKQTGLIITGHGLLQTLAHLDIATAPVDEQDFASEQDELAHLMADNAIAALLIKQTRIPKAIANMIAVTSCGNVRAAILQAEGYAITGELSEVPKHTAPVICASRSDSAKRAWETMRAKSQETTAEKELRTLWTSQGVPLKRQNELIADIAKKAAPGAYVGPFRIPA